ncbi:MAG: hypothetical protein VXZ40_05080, partial [Nanoarchaeota archaeon]|nr:hypothetical protein [Nanoarchaeota archaeon]
EKILSQDSNTIILSEKVVRGIITDSSQAYLTLESSDEIETKVFLYTLQEEDFDIGEEIIFSQQYLYDFVKREISLTQKYTTSDMFSKEKTKIISYT